jgi:hypothetical protein
MTFHCNLVSVVIILGLGRRAIGQGTGQDSTGIYRTTLEYPRLSWQPTSSHMMMAQWDPDSGTCNRAACFCTTVKNLQFCIVITLVESLAPTQDI